MKIKITGIALIAIGIILIGFAELNKETGKNSLNLSPDGIKKNNEESYTHAWLALFGLTLIVGGIIVEEPEKKSVHKKSLPALQEFKYTGTFPAKGKRLRHKSRSYKNLHNLSGPIPVEPPSSSLKRKLYI